MAGQVSQKKKSLDNIAIKRKQSFKKEVANKKIPMEYISVYPFTLISSK